MTRPASGDAPDHRVNLFVLGAQKGGTTALHRFLSAQDEVHAPSKEAHFFDFDDRYQDGGASALATYHREFSGHEQQRYWADCTPLYLYLPKATERLARYNPDARIILLLRHPADRAISQWNMEHGKGKERFSLPLALATERLRRGKGRHRVFSYLHRGFYSRQLEHLLTLFSREQILIIQTEDMQRDPLTVAKRVLRFLDLPQAGSVKIERVHEGKYTSVYPVTRYLLNLYFWAEQRRLKKRFAIAW